MSASVLDKPRTSKAAAPAVDQETTIAELRAEIIRLKELREQHHEKREKIRGLREQKTLLKSRLKEVNGEIESAVDQLLIDEQPTLFGSANGKPAEKPLTEVKPVDERNRLKE